MRFRAFAASVLAAAALVGCGSDDDASAPADVRSIPTVEPTSLPATLGVYFLRDGKVALASREVVAGPAVGRAALIQLLKGTTDAEARRGLDSAIPSGTELEDLAIDDGTAVVELSATLSERAIAQVVFTLTQFPSVQRVRLEGEQHVRGDFESQTPSVLVDSPLPSLPLSSPARIEGTANTFEATFNVEIVDGEGNVIGERFVTATSGSGTRGTFAAEVPFELDREGPGELVVFEVSAEDGSRTNELRIPVQLTFGR